MLFDKVTNLVSKISSKQNILPCNGSKQRGWSGGVMVLGKLPVPGHPTIWITVGQGHIYSHLSGVVGWCEGAG